MKQFNLTQYKHTFAGLSLIVGTCLGATTLALPIVFLDLGYQAAVILFIAAWAAMWSSGHLLAEVSACFPKGFHFMRMVHELYPGILESITWFFYMLLLYSLLALYLTGFVDLCEGVFPGIHPYRLIIILLEAGLGYLAIALGINRLAQLNYWVIFALMTVFVFFIVLLSQKAHWEQLAAVHLPHNIIYALPIVVTAFGYQVIIPTLHGYASRHGLNLRRLIFRGSFIVLLVYTLWLSTFFAVVNQALTHEFLAAKASIDPARLLPKLFSKMIHAPIINHLMHLFMVTAIMSSFLGIAVSLKDFIADSFKAWLPKRSGPIAIMWTLVPPVIFAIFIPHGFIWSLRYAGAFVALINLLLPMLLWLRLRSRSLLSTTLPCYVYYPLIVYIVIFSTAVLWVDFVGHVF